MIYLILYAFVVCSLLSSDIAGVKPILSLPTPKINQTRPTTPNQQASVNLTFPENLFSCPEFPPFDCPEEVENECENHKQCAILNRPDWDVSFMCCKDSCEKRCVPGKPNFDGAQKIMMENYIAQAKQLSCPAKPSRNDCTTKSAHKCSLDIECMTDKNQTFKCCSNGCENECMAGVNPILSLPTPKNLFSCPEFPPAEECPEEVENECENHKQCAKLASSDLDVFMCCIDGCEKRCVPGNPNFDRLQERPIKNYFAKVNQLSCPAKPSRNDCPAKPAHKCSWDIDCMTDKNETLKCCSNGCERECMAGVKPVPDIKSYLECPSNRYTCCEGILEIDNECSEDSDCANLSPLHLCCNDGCEHICVPGVPRPSYEEFWKTDQVTSKPAASITPTEQKTDQATSKQPTSVTATEQATSKQPTSVTATEKSTSPTKKASTTKLFEKTDQATSKQPTSVTPTEQKTDQASSKQPTSVTATEQSTSPTKKASATKPFKINAFKETLDVKSRL